MFFLAFPRPSTSLSGFAGGTSINTRLCAPDLPGLAWRSQMATATLPVTGKRKNQEAATRPPKAKRAALTPGNKASLGTESFDEVAQDAPSASGSPDAGSKLQPALVSAKQKNSKAKVTTREGSPNRISPQANGSNAGAALHVQIIAGSYERILHGVSARIPRNLLHRSGSDLDGDNADKVTFADTFLFAAHASAIRCLALSPSTEASKRLLATGSTDERINVYSISTSPPATSSKNSTLANLAINGIAEDPRNRSLGSLMNHDRAITCLQFPAKGKLFSAAEENTIAVSRTRDWTMLSSIKAPVPKPQGRPSGDTAAPGEVPTGVNGFAIHPSQKLMLSVSRGERALRLWNLMTGKKAGVLNFDRSLLEQVGEGRYGSGEGRQVLWDAAGENYVVGFERGAAVFGIDSKAKAIVRPTPGMKLHQLRMVRLNFGGVEKELLAVSTEDGRILFFVIGGEATDGGAEKLPQCPCIAQLGGKAAGVSGRIKDFEILAIPGESAVLLVVTASSDGTLRLWGLEKESSTPGHDGPAKRAEPQQVGDLIGTLETGNRITCLGAFVMDGKAEPNVATSADDEEFGGFDDNEDKDGDDDSE